ncbi:hypothetical protein D3C87_1730950 [compost metagenome]
MFERFLARFVLNVDRPFRDILERRHMGKQVETLKHHGHPGADAPDAFAGCIDAIAMNPDLAALIGLKPVDAAKQGRFAGSRRADDADDLALFHREGNVVDDFDRAETLADVLQFDDAHRDFPRRRSSHELKAVSGRLMAR